MRMTRLSRRRWLALAAGLAAGLAFGCGQQAGAGQRLPLPARARALRPRQRRRRRHQRAAGRRERSPRVRRHRRRPPSPPPAPAAQAAPAGGKRAEVITATQLSLPASLFWGVPNGWSNLSKIDALTGDWLVMPDADGALVPRLAREVPTLANGGARFEGEGAARRLRVTYTPARRAGLAGRHAADLGGRRVRLRASAHARVPADRPLAGQQGRRGPDAEPADRRVRVQAGRVRSGLRAGRRAVPEAPLERDRAGPAPQERARHEAGPRRPVPLKESRPNEHIIFEANPRYWAGPPKTPTIVMKVAADSNAMFAQAQGRPAGDHDVRLHRRRSAPGAGAVRRRRQVPGDRPAEHQHPDRRAERGPPDPAATSASAGRC